MSDMFVDFKAIIDINPLLREYLQTYVDILIFGSTVYLRGLQAKRRSKLLRDGMTEEGLTHWERRAAVLGLRWL